MSNPETATPPRAAISVMEAIYHRRAVRDFKPDKIDKATINELLRASVHAPSAMHEEAWAFSVIQDKILLNRLSEKVKELLTQGSDPVHPVHGSAVHGHFTSAQFNAFYNAETLIVICGKAMGPFVVADCWLAAENLMLAADAHGLGTCVIGLAVTALNTPEWKKELGILPDMTAYAPIILGKPAGVTPPVPRKEPQILIWK